MYIPQHELNKRIDSVKTTLRYVRLQIKTHRQKERSINSNHRMPINLKRDTLKGIRYRLGILRLHESRYISLLRPYQKSFTSQRRKEAYAFQRDIKYFDPDFNFD